MCLLVYNLQECGVLGVNLCYPHSRSLLLGADTVSYRTSNLNLKQESCYGYCLKVSMLHLDIGLSVMRFWQK